VCEVILFTFRS